jgi:multicomponent K+:H+ antiporter subunit D
MGLNGAFLTGDVFNLFVFFEVLLIASYGLLLHGSGGARSRAGFTYVVLNLVGSSVFLIALGILYGTLGTLNLADIAAHVQAAPADRLPMVYVGALLLFSVFALKAGIVLLHYWLPGAYSVAQAPVAALFAIMTKVGVYAILRIFGVAFPEGEVAGWLASWMTPLGLATVLVGSLGMLAATRLGRLIAYQVIASVGTLLAVFGLASEFAYAAGLYYLVHSTLATGLLFLLCGVIAEARGEAGDRLYLGPLMHAAGPLAVLFVIGAASMVGLPPFSGFIGKLLVLQAAQPSPYFASLWTILLLAGLLNLIAWSRAGSLLFWKAAPSGLKTAPVSRLAWGGVAGLAVLSLAMVVYAGPLTDAVGVAAAQMNAPSGYVADVLGAGPRP